MIAKKTKTKLIRFLGAVLISGFSQLVHADWGQGVTVKFSDLNNLAVGGTNTYQFDPVAGGEYFTDENTGVTWTCTGSVLQCSEANRPMTPAAPAPDPTQAQSLATSVKCIFLDGGTLTATSAYEQTLSIPGLSGTGTFTYTFTYTVSPAVSYLTPLTAWTLISSGGSTGMATVIVKADIGAESVITSGSSKAYSFALRGTNGSNRLTNLVLLLNGKTVAKPAAKIMTNCPGCLAGSPGAIDFNYVTNAGTSGNSALLTNGDARTLLNTDSYAGNNNGGKYGAALELAKLNPVSMSLGVGSYTLKLKGRVNATGVVATQDFEVSSQVAVVGLGCSAP